MHKRANQSKYKSIKFIPLSVAVGKRLKSKNFSRAYTEELNRLQLAHEIKVLREKSGMTQNAIADKAEMPQSVVARIESGTHSFSIGTLSKLARVLDRRISLVK